MKRYSLLTAVLAAALIVQMAGIQDAGAQDRTFGLGIGLSPLTLSEHGIDAGLVSTVSALYVPITVSPGFRLEPEFGISRFSGDSGGFSGSETQFLFGLGLLGRQQRGDVSIYYGTRPAVLRTSFGGDLDGSRTSARISGVFGGEYFFSPHLGIGGEAQGNFFIIGDFDDNEDWPDSGLMTNVVLFVRWYP
jgi:hypothetical protein